MFLPCPCLAAVLAEGEGFDFAFERFGGAAEGGDGVEEFFTIESGSASFFQIRCSLLYRMSWAARPAPR